MSELGLSDCSAFPLDYVFSYLLLSLTCCFLFLVHRNFLSNSKRELCLFGCLPSSFTPFLSKSYLPFCAIMLFSHFQALVVTIFFTILPLFSTLAKAKNTHDVRHTHHHRARHDGEIHRRNEATVAVEGQSCCNSAFSSIIFTKRIEQLGSMLLWILQQ